MTDSMSPVGIGEFPAFDLTGKIAFVTGAARGLGRAISLALAHAGADVAFADVSLFSDPDRGTELVDEIERMGRHALPLALDVTDLAQVNVGIRSALDRFGRLDILVNNAGGGPPAPAVDVSPADFDFTFNLNVKALFFVSQAVGRVMISQHFGRIINMSSQAGFVALPGEPVYCASKAAVAHLTKCLAVEWGSYGVNVNAVAPTFIRTPGTEARLDDPVFRADLIERIAGLHRIGEPMDVAGAVVFLASPAASLITGTTLLVDGGWTAR
jgi:NAD(P)-dependent dehydrogenase (short-subunit alcohol dehydrogenase family)